MNVVGPTWALVITLDSLVVTLLTLANVAFAALMVLLVFRRRPTVDRVLVGLGVFFIVTVGSLVGLSLFSGTPVRDAQVLVLD